MMRLQRAFLYPNGDGNNPSERIHLNSHEMGTLPKLEMGFLGYLDLTLVADQVTTAMMRITGRPMSVEHIEWERAEKLIIRGDGWDVVYGR